MIQLSELNAREPLKGQTAFINVSVISKRFTGFECGLVIEKDKVVDVGEVRAIMAKYRETARFVDASGMTLVPGFINAHTHTAMGMFRDIAHGESNIIEEVFFRIEKSLNPNDIEALSYSYIYDGLRSGVTCFVDHYFYIDGVARALQRFGLKGVLGETTADLGGPFPSEGQWHKEKEKIDNWKWGPDIMPAVCPHAADTVSEGLLKGMAEFAQRRGLPLHMHLSQTQKENDEIHRRHKISAVEMADTCGAIGEKSLLAHMVSVNQRDLHIVRDRGATIAFCPASQILYEKMAPIKGFVDKGIPVALGTDCAGSNDRGDILSEMRFAALMCRDRGMGKEAYDRVFDMVSTNPAHALGLKDIGDFEPGYKADVVFIRQELDTLPITDLKTNLLFSQSSRNVAHVMVNGNWRLWNQQPVLISAEEIRLQYLTASAGYSFN